MYLKRILSMVIAVIIIMSAFAFNVFADANEATPDETQKKACISHVDGFYMAQVGDILVYSVELYAEELFENIQGTISFNHNVLELADISEFYPDMPNMNGTSYVFYKEYADGQIKFNASSTRGMDYSEEKVLFNIGLRVVSPDFATIDTQIEFMTIKGGHKHYFFNSEPEITEGIKFTANVTPAVLESEEPTIPEVPTQTQIIADETIYNANVGDTVAFTVDLFAEQLFENIQATVYYDSTVLELTDIAGVLPPISNLGNSSYVLNTEYKDGIIKFNASNIHGIDFTEESSLLNLGFNVKSTGTTEIDFHVEFMTIKGGKQHYFFNGEPMKIDGISIKETITPVVIPKVCGDADRNGKVNVKDATELQKYIASMVDLSDTALTLADANLDGKVNVKDATAIQKHAAGFFVNDVLGQLFEV